MRTEHIAQDLAALKDSQTSPIEAQQIAARLPGHLEFLLELVSDLTSDMTRLREQNARERVRS